MERDEITRRIDEILEPYLGRVDYGNLRKAKEWSSYPMVNKTYNLGFEINFSSSTVIAIEVWDNDTISFHHMNHRYSIEKGFKIIERLIKAIPNHRIKKTIKRVIYEKEKGYASSFEELLEKECKELGKKETDFYTEEELKRLREYFSKVK